MKFIRVQYSNEPKGFRGRRTPGAQKVEVNQKCTEIHRLRGLRDGRQHETKGFGMMLDSHPLCVLSDHAMMGSSTRGGAACSDDFCEGYHGNTCVTLAHTGAEAGLKPSDQLTSYRNPNSKASPRSKRE